MAASTLRVTDLLNEHVVLDVEFGPGLPEWVCADAADVGWGVVVLPEAPRVPDRLTCVDGEDRHQVPPVCGQVRRCQPDPDDAVRQGGPQDRGDAPPRRGAVS